jgi:nucleoid-associated protein YgaU
MRFARAAFLLPVSIVLTGCGYVHFGRLPSAPHGDAALAAAFSDLTTEHKILKQELALARKESDTLRVALERTGSGTAPGTSSDLVSRLGEVSQELATLRANYTKLKSERGTEPTSDPRMSVAAKTELEENLAASLRNSRQLQTENAQLRADLEKTRAENASLSEQLKIAAGRDERAQAELAQLNLDLLAQKEARARAENAATAVRAQLDTVLAHGGGIPSAMATRESAVSIGSALQTAKAPPAGSLAIAELRTNPVSVGTSPAFSMAVVGRTTARSPRVHVVQAGDTLESIARQYFGTPDRWREIRDANATLLRGTESLRTGMELQLPEN